MNLIINSYDVSPPRYSLQTLLVLTARVAGGEKLVNSQGDVVARFSSGPTGVNPNSTLPAKGHVEVKAAYDMRDNGMTEGILYHNNPNGTCNMCNSNISTALDTGSQMRVVPPAGTVIRSRYWFVKPDPYVGK